MNLFLQYFWGRGSTRWGPSVEEHKHLRKTDVLKTSFKKRGRGFVDERAMIKTTLMSS